MAEVLVIGGGGREAAYSAIDIEDNGPESGKIGFAGKQVRRDIGHQARVNHS